MFWPRWEILSDLPFAVQNINITYLGGWDPDARGVVVPDDIHEEIAQAFSNVELALRSAGGKGWCQVFRINSYHTNLTPEITMVMGEHFRKWMPNQKPIWVAIGVSQLGAPGMHVEIQVVAFDPKLPIGVNG